LNGGKGTISNQGLVRIIAGANAEANSVSKPIRAANWTGDGTFEAIGGSWNLARHAFSVSEVAKGVSGTTLNIDRRTTQRIAIADPETQQSFAASFSSSLTSKPMAITAKAIRGMKETHDLPGNEQEFIAGWHISSGNGHAAGETMYLSFSVDPQSGKSVKQFQIWYSDGTHWKKISADDLNYDGSCVGFLAHSLGSYVITAPTQDYALKLLSCCGLGWLAIAWMKKRKTRKACLRYIHFSMASEISQEKYSHNDQFTLESACRLLGDRPRFRFFKRVNPRRTNKPSIPQPPVIQARMPSVT
jgi:hypothetical protein